MGEPMKLSVGVLFRKCDDTGWVVLQMSMPPGIRAKFSKTSSNFLMLFRTQTYH
jgi:hypothetical protein